MQKVVQDSVDLTEKYTKAGITEDSFVKDGYLLELMLLSALRSDSLSNLGYNYIESFIVKLGSCSANISFGYVMISDVVQHIFGVNKPILKLKGNRMRYHQLSVLANLLIGIGVYTERVRVFDYTFFVDIAPSVSFTINRVQRYIRNLKETIERAYDDGDIRIKAKSCMLNTDTQKEIDEKLENIEQMYTKSLVSRYKGNIGLYASLGDDVDGILFFKTTDDYIHAYTKVYLYYNESVKHYMGDICITVNNLGYNSLLDIEGVLGYEENTQSIVQLHDDMRAGFNFVLGLLDAWSSPRDNRFSVFR